ncbi:MAG: hypothetical protein NT061_08605 [Spirochaetes bacterium]|nr:hypothetical protein [Spirochaetota bacterium]
MSEAFVGDPVSLLAGLPRIRRARGWRLYGEDGRRFLDLWADAGRTVTGRRTGSQGRLAKELLDRGLVSDFPSFWEKRLLKELASWLPHYSAFRFYPTESEVLSILGCPESSLGRERPFGSYLGDGSKADLAFVTLPLASAWFFTVLAAKKDVSLAGLPSPAPQATIKLALGTRALAEFREFEHEVGEHHWSRLDKQITGLFERKGPWLIPSYAERAHTEVFEACLAAGLLISPLYSEPSFIPGEFDEGEVAPLRKLPRP